MIYKVTSLFLPTPVFIFQTARENYIKPGKIFFLVPAEASWLEQAKLCLEALSLDHRQGQGVWIRVEAF